MDAVTPPSTGRATPVTIAASSLARKATTEAISEGSAGRPSGQRSLNLASTFLSFCMSFVIGVRVKLASEGSGKWRDSAGDKSKFGLFITEILEVVEILRAELEAAMRLSGVSRLSDIERSVLY